MTTSESSSETLDNYDSSRFRRVRVHIQRLLDALNKGFHTSKLQTSPDFLPLF